MSEQKRNELIQQAINEFFNIFPDLYTADFTKFMIEKTSTKNIYRVELISDGKSYLHYVTKEK